MAKITMDSQQYSDILQVTSILGIIAGMGAEKELVSRFISGAITHIDSLPPDKKTPDKRILSLELMIRTIQGMTEENPAAELLDVYLKREDNPPDVMDDMNALGFMPNDDGSWTPPPSMNYRSMLERMRKSVPQTTKEK